MLPIYVDIDDVLADSTRSFVHLFEREFGRRVAFEDVVSFDFKVSFGLNDAEFNRFFRMIHRPEVMIDFEPMDGAVDLLKRWSRSGYPIHVVTGRPAASLEVSVAWLEKYDVPRDDVILVDKYGRGDGDRHVAISLEELAAMPFCLAVEDSAEMAHHLSGKMGVPVALFDRPWNQDAQTGRRLRRCRTWADIDRIFESRLNHRNRSCAD